MSNILTPRETEVMELIARGYTDAEIGRKLYISESTVKAKSKNIKKKIPVEARRSRASLTAWYVEWKHTLIRGCATAVVKDPSAANIRALAKALEEGRYL